MSVAVRRTMWLIIGAMFALAVVVAAAAQSGSDRAGAVDTQTVHVKQGSLDQGCGDQSIIGAHFVITQITTPPSSITVQLSDGSTVNVALSKQLQQVAHYTTMFSAGLEVTDATAVLPVNWTGQFVLSHYICGPGGTTTPPTSSTPPSSPAPPTGSPTS